MRLDEKQQLLRQIRCSGLTAQQKRTLKGQILAGDLACAKKGYERLMEAKNNSRKDEAV